MAAQDGSTSTDWTKIIGLILAAAIFAGGYAYLQNRSADRMAKYEKELAAWKAEQEAQEKKAREEAEAARARAAENGETAPRPPVMTSGDKPEPKTGDGPATETGDGPQGETPKKDPPTPAAPQIAPAKDVVVVNDHLRLTFQQKGAALKSAVLTEYSTSAGVKPADDPLEILNEIQRGAFTFGITYFDYDGHVYKDMESRDWALVGDSKDFDANGAWTVSYMTVLRNTVNEPIAEVTKTFHIQKDQRHLALDVSVKNVGQQEARYEYQIRGAAGILLDGPAKDPTQDTYIYYPIRVQLAARAAAQEAPDIMVVFPYDMAKDPPDEDTRRVSNDENLWAATNNRFFKAIAVARQPARIIKIFAEGLRVGDERSEIADDKRYKEMNLGTVFVRRKSPPLAPGATEETPDGYALYLGPSTEKTIDAFENELNLESASSYYLSESVFYCDIYGWQWPNVDRFARLIVWGFEGIAWLTGSFGLAVLLLTMLIKLALHPMQRKMTVSMHKMQMLKPKLDAIEAKYKNQTDPQVKQKKELEKWDLMKKEGANPGMSCLPMLLQMPIFFALYGAFSHAYDLRQASFLWIKDLSLTDNLTTVAGWQVNLLPIIYILMTFLQMRLQPKPKDPDPQQDLQRKMMMFFPLVFAFIFYKMPAGLVLYFAASALFGFLESTYVKRFVLKVDMAGNPLPDAKKDEPAAAKPATS